MILMVLWFFILGNAYSMLNVNMDSPLCELAYSGDPVADQEKIKQEISSIQANPAAGFDRNTSTGYPKYTPLMCALNRPKSDERNAMVDVLLNNGIATNHHDIRLLEKAIEVGNVAIIHNFLNVMQNSPSLIILSGYDRINLVSKAENLLKETSEQALHMVLNDFIKKIKHKDDPAYLVIKDFKASSDAQEQELKDKLHGLFQLILIDNNASDVENKLKTIGVLIGEPQHPMPTIISHYNRIYTNNGQNLLEFMVKYSNIKSGSYNLYRCFTYNSKPEIRALVTTGDADGDNLLHSAARNGNFLFFPSLYNKSGAEQRYVDKENDYKYFEILNVKNTQGDMPYDVALKSLNEILLHHGNQFKKAHIMHYVSLIDSFAQKKIITTHDFLDYKKTIEKLLQQPPVSLNDFCDEHLTPQQTIVVNGLLSYLEVLGVMQNSEILVIATLERFLKEDTKEFLELMRSKLKKTKLKKQEKIKVKEILSKHGINNKHGRFQDTIEYFLLTHKKVEEFVSNSHFKRNNHFDQVLLDIKLSQYKSFFLIKIIFMKNQKIIVLFLAQQ